MAVSDFDVEEEDRDSPLPTPTFPSYLYPQQEASASEEADSESMFSSLQSFSFGRPSSSTSTGPSFPSYCIPRRRSSAQQNWTDANDNDGPGAEGGGARRLSKEELNPSPVYAPLNPDGSFTTMASTPTAERERFEYPLPPGQTEPIDMPTRPNPTPNTERRGSTSLPNLPTTSHGLLPLEEIPIALTLPAPPLPPSRKSSLAQSTIPRSAFSSVSSSASGSSSSSSANQYTFNPPSPLPNHHSHSPFHTPLHFTPQPPPRRTSLTRSMSSTHRIPSTGAPPPPSSTQTHHHPPPAHRFHPSTAPGPIPPSLRGHPALAGGGGLGGGRRGSLPVLPGLPPRGMGLGMAKRVSISGGHAMGGMGRRGSLVEKGVRERVNAEPGQGRGVSEEGRPRLGSIPSFGSDGSGSGSGSDGGKTPT